MVNEKEIYAHLKKGGDPQDLFDAFLKEVNNTQKKIDQEAQEAAAKEEKKKELVKVREAAVAALTDYLTLVLGEEIHEDIIRAAIVDLEQSIEVIKSLAVSMNGKDTKSILDLLFR